MLDLSTEVRFKIMSIVQSMLSRQYMLKSTLSNKLWERERKNTQQLLQLEEIVNYMTTPTSLQNAPNRQKVLSYLIDSKGYSNDDARDIHWEDISDKDKMECKLFSI